MTCKPLNSKKAVFELAKHHSSNRELSAEQMKKYLTRKLEENEPNEIISSSFQQNDSTSKASLKESWIKEAIEECLILKLIDDKRCSEILASQYDRRSKGENYISHRLKEKGLPIEPLLNSDKEKAKAEKILSKSFKLIQSKAIRKIEKLNATHYSEITLRSLLTQLLIEKLVREGFSHSISISSVATYLAQIDL